MFLLCISATLSAQNGITVSGLVVTAGSPTTVTFNVAWDKHAANMPSLWLDSAWVFVDYNDAGAMKRLPLSAGATLTETSAPGVGKVEYDDNNNQGVWVIGNAKTANSGSFSATVQLLTSAATVTGVCAYASNYPPVGEYSSPTHLSFTGTPEYDIVLKHIDGSASVTHSGGEFDVPASYTVQSFTDRTGAPGITGCMAPAVATLTASASGFCAGGEGVAFGLSDTETGVKYQLYNGTAAVGSTVLTGTGSAATFSGTFNAAGTYTAVSVADGVYCAVSMNGVRNISENPTPTAPVIPRPADVCQDAGDIVFTAAGYTGTLEWVSVGGGVESLLNVTFGSSVTDTKTVTARSAQTYTDASTCYSAGVTQSATVNPLPAAPTGVGSARCGAGTLTLSASSSGAVIDWYNAASGGSVLSGGSATNSYTTPSIDASTTYYAQARIAATGCVSATRLAVSSTVNAIPAAPTGASANARCGAGTVTFSATAPAGCTIDWYTTSTGTTLVSGGSGVTSFSPSINSSTTYYAQARNTTTGCVSATRLAVAATVNAIPAAPTGASANARCGAGTVTFSATAPAGCTIDWYTAASGGSTVSGGSGVTSFAPSINSSTTYYAQARNTTTGCVSATRLAVSSTVNAIPAAPTGASANARCGAGTVTFSATAPAGCTIDWYTAASGGSTVSGGSGGVTSFSPSINSSTTYYAQARIEATGCVSAARTAVLATVVPNPTITTQPAATSTCAGTTVQLSVAATNATAYQWRKNGANVADGSGSTTANYITGTLSASATYSVVVSNGGTCTVTSADAAVTVHTPPTAPTGLSSNVTAICNGVATSMTLTATGGHAGSGAVYEWGTGSAVGSSLLSPATTTAATRTVSTSAAVTYWVRLKGTTSCTTVTGGMTTAIGVYPAVAPGAIQTALATTTEGTAPAVTVGSETAASGGSGSLTYVWRRTGTSSATLTGAAATYPLNSDASNYSTAGTYYFNRYVKDNTCNTVAVASGIYTLGVERPGIDQPQGSCTYTEPAVVGTFASFPANYSASTYVSLTDERDNKNYPVVKIGSRWIMARNLNYQTGLTHQTYSYRPVTSMGGGVTELIGHFWCPGGNPSSTATTTSTLASCEVWGALYSWETAMSFNGKGGWTENSQHYNTGPANASGAQFNHGRTANGSGTGGRGICPPNWHVPTDYEWGLILDDMESGGGNAHSTASTHDWFGTNAGSRAKSKCTAPDGASVTYFSDTQANWYYSFAHTGTDVFGFRALPSGSRLYDGNRYKDRGLRAYLWSSSNMNSARSWYCELSSDQSKTRRAYAYRSNGHSVRCLRD
jgi:uncharacterized protein (TIGR02145 family)